MITSGEVYKYLFNNVMQETFNREGWLQLGVFSKCAYGSVIKLQLSSVYINSRNSQREITICAGYDDIVISELVLDQVGVFDKIKICKTELGGNYYILVHYTPNTENHVLLSVNVSSYDTQIIIPTLEIAESRNYIFTKEINLGNNGFYVNGAKIT